MKSLFETQELSSTLPSVGEAPSASAHDAAPPEAPATPAPTLAGVAASIAERLDALHVVLKAKGVALSRDGERLVMRPHPGEEVKSEVAALKPWLIGQIIIDEAYESVKGLPAPPFRTDATKAAFDEWMKAGSDMQTAYARCDLRAVESAAKRWANAQRKYSEAR